MKQFKEINLLVGLVLKVPQVLLLRIEWCLFHWKKWVLYAVQSAGQLSMWNSASGPPHHQPFPSSVDVAWCDVLAAVTRWKSSSNNRSPRQPESATSSRATNVPTGVGCYSTWLFTFRKIRQRNNWWKKAASTFGSTRMQFRLQPVRTKVNWVIVNCNFG